MKRTQLWMGLIALAVALVACDIPVATPASSTSTTDPEPAATSMPTPVPATPTATPVPLAALVNGEAILLEDYERQVARYEAAMAASGQDPSTAEGQAALAQDRAWVLEIMIDQVLIEQAARNADVTVSDADVDAAIVSIKQDIGEEAFDQWLVDEAMTFEEMRETLRSEMVSSRMANRIAEKVPARAEHIQARHILLNTEEEARQILDRLQAGEDFVTLARTYSQDPNTRDTGGDLGYFPQGVLISPEVEAAAFGLQPGQVSDVVQSSLGYHIVQVVQRVPDMEISPENMNLLREKAVREWLESLRVGADIQRFVPTTS